MKSITVSYTCCETTSCCEAEWDLRADTQGVGFEPLHSTDPQIVKMGNPFCSVSRDIKRINLFSSTFQGMVYGSWTSQQHGKKVSICLNKTRKFRAQNIREEKRQKTPGLKTLFIIIILPSEEALADIQKMKANFAPCIYSRFKVQLAWAGPLFTESNAMGRSGTVTRSFPAFGSVLASQKSGLWKVEKIKTWGHSSAANQAKLPVPWVWPGTAGICRVGGKEGVMGWRW